MQAHAVNAMQDEGGSPPVALDHMTLQEAPIQGLEKQGQNIEAQSNQNEPLESQNEHMPDVIYD